MAADVGDDGPETDRIRATKAVLPFLFLGLFNVALLVMWGVKPLWGLLIVPPIAFVTVIGWIAFRTGFVR